MWRPDTRRNTVSAYKYSLLKIQWKLSVTLSWSPELWKFKAIPPSLPFREDNFHLLHFYSHVGFYGERLFSKTIYLSI